MKSIAIVSLAAFIGLGVTTVAAQPLVPQTATMQHSSENVIQIDNKYNNSNKYKNNKYNNNKYNNNKHKKWVYSEKYGHRYRHKQHGYGYYYNGWWYQRPYWQPGITIQLGL